MKAINKELGDGTVRLASDPKYRTRVLPTGVLPIDVIFNGGIPRNRTTEIYGGWSTLKSFIAYNCIAKTQADGGVCALVDTEHSFDEQWAVSIGIDIDKLLMPPTHTGEEAVDVTEILVRNGIDLVVWDSVAATMPQDEGRKRLGGKEHMQPGRQAALMSATMRRITSVNENTALLFINQTREKVGVVFGNPETTPGGHALPFYASYRLALRKGSTDREEVETFDGINSTKVKRVASQTVNATLEKSKLSSPGREYRFQWNAKHAQIDEAGFIMAIGLEQGWIKKTNAKWSYGRKSINGKDAFKKWIQTDEKIREEMTQKCLGSPTGSDEPGNSKAGAPRRRLRKRTVAG